MATSVSTFSRAAFVFGLFACGSLAAPFVGCAGTEDAPAAAPDAGRPVCPNTVQAAVGAKCSSEGFACAVGYYNCGATAHQAICTCRNGAFECIDDTDTKLAPGQTPGCVPQGGGNDDQCPAGPTSNVEAKACQTVRLLCNYTGATCPEPPSPRLDVCECTPLADGGLAFRCSSPTCTPRLDGGSAEAGPDASDAGTDAASVSDASSD